MRYRENFANVVRAEEGEILEAEACPDHIPMLVSNSAASECIAVCRLLKMESSLMIFDCHANLKYKYGNRHLLCRGYYVNTVGANQKAIAEYIRHQLDEDMAYEQMTFNRRTSRGHAEG